jgi:hypothetical protein
VSDPAYRHRGGDEPLLDATIPEHFAAILEHASATAKPWWPGRRSVGGAYA